jgi:hypothetical protein
VKFKVVLGAGLACAASLVLAGCAAEAPRPPVRTYYSSAVRATPSSLTAQAAPFAGFMRQARGVDASFSGPDEVAGALQTAAGREPRQFETGMIAYAALAALEEPRFVEALQREPDRDALARRLAADPALALSLPGGQGAAARASGALATQGQALHEQGLRVKRAAYKVQRQAWSKRPVRDAARRLARVKRLAAEPFPAQGGESARIYAAMAESQRQAGPAGPAVSRAVAVAALNVLGEGGEGRRLMSEPRAASCLRLARLNLYQCLAAAGPEYEDIYCLGQHAMAETGQCVADAARPAHVGRRASYRR